MGQISDISEMEDTNGKARPVLLLPPQVVLRCRASWGPFARGNLAAGLVSVPLVNGSLAPLTISRIILTPPTDAGSGLSLSGAPAPALSATTETAELKPGEATTVTISGTVPARPGTWAARLEVLTSDGVVAQAPLSVTVAASPRWGISCMLVGLFVIGL